MVLRRESFVKVVYMEIIDYCRNTFRFRLPSVTLSQCTGNFIYKKTYSV